MIQQFCLGKQHWGFVCSPDAWEALNMAQLDKLDKLNAILSTTSSD
jgi:hypothetical protein